MLDRSAYTDDMTNLGFGGVTAISVEGHYSIKVEDPDTNCPIATCYKLTATPVAGGAQAGDARCTKFILDSTGAKTAEGSTPNECW